MPSRTQGRSFKSLRDTFLPAVRLQLCPGRVFHFVKEVPHDQRRDAIATAVGINPSMKVTGHLDDRRKTGAFEPEQVYLDHVSSQYDRKWLQLYSSLSRRPNTRLMRL